MLFFICFTEICCTQEVQIPVDKECKIEYIDTKLEKKLQLFPEYSNFREARLFQISDTLFVLEISYKLQEKSLKDRIHFSLEEADNFLQKVTERIIQKDPQVVLDQTGRTKLIASTMTLSMGYYGWVLPMMLEVNDGKLAAALYMLSSGAGFYVPYSVTRKIPVSDAAATLSLYGGTRGIIHGIALAYLFDEEPLTKDFLGLGMLVSFSELFAGYSIANKFDLSAGTSETIGVGGDFGIGLGLGAAHLAGFIDNENNQAVAASVLLVTGMGLAGGKMLADHQPYTRGDSYVLNTMGFLGAYIPLALVDISGTEDEKIYTTSSMLGNLAGLGLGHNLLRGKDSTTGKGNLVRLSGLAGGLIGLGLAYLVDEDEDTTLYLTSSSIGATAGFWLMYRSYVQSARTSENESSWDINILPGGLFALTMGKKLNSNQNLHFPLLSFNFNF